MARDPCLHHDAALRREQAIAAEGDPASPEGRAAEAGGASSGARLSGGMPGLLRGAQHLVDEALGLAGTGAANAARPDAELFAAVIHGRMLQDGRMRPVPKSSL